jgi:hypothetical protein
MTNAQRLICYALRSNAFSRHPIVGLASCCRIAPPQTPRKRSKTFDPTGSQGDFTRTVTSRVTFRRQDLTLEFEGGVKLFNRPFPVDDSVGEPCF